jgi:hypothetical protein
MNERGHLSTETLDLLALSALAATDAQLAQGHLSGCGTCKRRWDELNEDKQRFEQFVFPRTLASVEARARKGSSAWSGLAARWRMLVPALGLAAAGVIAVVVIPRGSVQTPYVGVKGGPSMEVVARRGETQFPVREGSHLRARDQIRFVVDPAGAKYLLIASRDGNGTLSVYFPYNGAQSAPLMENRQELPNSIELDGVTGPERLYAFFSDAPLRTDDVKSELSKHSDKLDGIPGVKEAVIREFVKDPQ